MRLSRRWSGLRRMITVSTWLAESTVAGLASPMRKRDIEKALKLAGDKPEIVLEMAGSAVTASDQDEARRILEAGLTKLQASAELYLALADLELRSRHTDKAIETLERGLKSVAKKDDLQWMLANYLAMRGDTSKLLLQIEELKKLGFNPNLLQFIKGYYHVNASQFREARQVLAPLEGLTGWPPHLKSRIGDLLARCYGQLGEPELQQEAYLRAERQPAGHPGQDRLDRPHGEAR